MPRTVSVMANEDKGEAERLPRIGGHRTRGAGRAGPQGLILSRASGSRDAEMLAGRSGYPFLRQRVTVAETVTSNGSGSAATAAFSSTGSTWRALGPMPTRRRTASCPSPIE